MDKLKTVPDKSKKTVPFRITPHRQNRDIITTQTLKLLIQTNPILNHSQIAIKRETSRRNINKLFNKYIEKGYITKQKELTEKGKLLINKTVPKMLMVSDTVPTQTVRLHDLQFTIRILEKPRDWDKHRTTITKIKKYNPSKWNLNTGALMQELILANNVRVRVTPTNVLILPQDIYATDPSIALNKAIEIMEATKPQIENLFNIKLDKDRKVNTIVSRQHIAFIYNHIAKYCKDNKIYLRVRDDKGELRIITDDSHGFCELEFINPKHGEMDAKTILEKDLEDKILNEFYPASKLSKMMDSQIKTHQELVEIVGEMGKQIHNVLKVQEASTLQTKNLIELQKGSTLQMQSLLNILNAGNTEPKAQVDKPEETTDRPRYIG